MGWLRLVARRSLAISVCHACVEVGVGARQSVGADLVTEFFWLGISSSIRWCRACADANLRMRYNDGRCSCQAAAASRACAANAGAP